MANKLKGEVGLVSNGDTSKREVRLESGGRSYTMIFSINALCELENDFDDVIAEVAAVLSGTGKKRLTMMRRVFRAGLSDYHPEVTEKQAGLLITALGAHAAFAKMAEAFTLAFPPVEGAWVPLDGSASESTGSRS
jgi:hypothetical protein